MIVIFCHISLLTDRTTLFNANQLLLITRCIAVSAQNTPPSWYSYHKNNLW